MSDGASDDWFENEYLRNQLESNRNESITLEVIKDLKEREQFGALKYGKFLTPHSNEDMMQHLYEELLDAALYIKNEITIRKNANNK
jgi:hypothetical protein